MHSGASITKANQYRYLSQSGPKGPGIDRYPGWAYWIDVQSRHICKRWCFCMKDSVIKPPPLLPPSRCMFYYTYRSCTIQPQLPRIPGDAYEVGILPSSSELSAIRYPLCAFPFQGPPSKRPYGHCRKRVSNGSIYPVTSPSYLPTAETKNVIRAAAGRRSHWS